MKGFKAFQYELPPAVCSIMKQHHPLEPASGFLDNQPAANDGQSKGSITYALHYFKIESAFTARGQSVM